MGTPSKLKLIISKEELVVIGIAVINDRAITVNALGPKRSPREITIYFDRHGVIQYGYLEAQNT